MIIKEWKFAKNVKNICTPEIKSFIWQWITVLADKTGYSSRENTAYKK